MAEITKELGRIPVTRGEYEDSITYYKDNIVQYKRGSYQVASESPIVGVPPTNDKNIVNPGWTLFAGTLDAQDVVNQIKEQEAKSIQAVADREAEILTKSDAAKVSFDNTGTSLSGTNVQDALKETDGKINQLKNAGYLYAGIATPTTNPGTPEGPAFYIATQAGSYSNFSNIEVLKGETVILKWNNGTWVKSAFKPMTDFDSVFDASGKSLTNKLDTLGSNISELEDELIDINFSKHIYNGQDFSSSRKLSFDSDKLYNAINNNNYTGIVKEVHKGDVVYVTANGGTYVGNYFCTFVATDKSMNIIYRHDVGPVENQEYVITEDGFIAVSNLVIQGKEPQLVIYTKRDLNVIKRQNYNLFDNSSGENEDGYIYLNNVKTASDSYFTTHWFNAVGKIKIEGISQQTRLYFLVDGVREEKLLAPTDNVLEYEIEEQYIGKQVSFYAIKSEKLTLVVTDNSQSGRHLESDILIDESQIVNRGVSPTPTPTPTETKSIIESTIYEDYSRERGLINQSGVLVDNPAAATTEKIFVNEGDFIQFALYHIQAYPIISAYDSSNNFISEKSLFVSGYSSGTRGVMVGTYIVPIDVSYIRISTYWAWSGTYRLPEYLRFCVCKHIDVPVYSHNEGVQLNGKKWVAFGTSITDDIFENSVEAPNVTGKYFKHLVHKSGMIATNFGLAGSSIVGKMLNMIKGNPSDELVGKYYENIVPDADIITIEGFVNDYAENKPIGEITDTGDTTVCGCLYQAISHLRNISNATIVIITDSSGKSDASDFSINRLNGNGLTQSQFNDGIIKMAKHLGCYVIDAGSESGICSLNPQYIVDNIHHTELGGKQFANAIWARLKDVQLMEK